jgi:adenosylcobinamide-phosphate synthase
LSQTNLSWDFLPLWQPSSFALLEDRLIVLMVALVANAILLSWRIWIEIPKGLMPGYGLELYLKAAERKLNRPNRSANAKLFRGALVILPPLCIAVYIGDFLGHASTSFKYSWLIASATMACLLHGRAFHDVACHLLLRNHDMSLYESRVKLDSISPYDHTVLDQHGVFRQTMETIAAVFSERMVGLGAWFLIGGLPAACAYYVLHRAYRLIALPSNSMRPFGWAAAGLYNLMAAWPAWFGSFLLAFSTLFVPGTHATQSVGAFLSGLFRYAPAQLSSYVYAKALGLQLGGKKRLLNGTVTDHAWVGDGQPKVTESQLRYGLGMFQIAWLLFLGILGVCYLYLT